MNQIQNIIYCVLNEKQKCFYIGYTTKGLNWRKNKHYYACFKKNQNIKFYNYIKKYGWDSFKWKEVAEYSPEKLPQAEIDWLAWHREKYPNWEMLNSRDAGGGGNYWKYMSKEKIKEVKRKISKTIIEKGLSKGENNPFYGRKHTENTLQKLRVPKKEKTKQLIGQKAKERFKNKENHPMFGKHQTEEAKEKIRKNHPNMEGENNPFYGQSHTEETRKKMKLAWEKRKIRK